MEKLQMELVRNRIQEMNDWVIVEEKWLRKRYRFKQYMDGISFVNQIALLSEEKKHHPFLSIDYLVVTVKLTSWRANGITELDLTLIEKYDRIYEDMVK